MGGDLYEGGYVDFRKEGKGKYTFANGDVYEGGWVADRRSGKGTFTRAGTRTRS